MKHFTGYSKYKNCKNSKENMSFTDSSHHLIKRDRYLEKALTKKITILRSQLPDEIHKSRVKLSRIRRKQWCELCCRVKANCPLVGSGPTGKVPPVGFFLRDPPHLCYASFGENNENLRMAKIHKCDRGLNPHLPTSFESRTARTLVGLDVSCEQ